MSSFRHVIRRLGHSPGFTAACILTLAIGIGASTAIFSVVYGVLLKPLPFPESDRLVSVWQTAPSLNVGDLNASPATYYTYREEPDIRVHRLWRRNAASITGIAEPEQIRVLRVTDGVLPLLGRWFTRQDDEPHAPATASWKPHRDDVPIQLNRGQVFIAEFRYQSAAGLVRLFVGSAACHETGPRHQHTPEQRTQAQDPPGRVR